MFNGKDSLVDLSAVDGKQSYKKAEDEVSDRPVEPKAPATDPMSFS